MTKEKAIALGVVGVILLVIIVVIAVNLKSITTTEGGGSTSTSGGGLGDVFDSIVGLFSRDKVAADYGANCFNPTSTHVGCLSNKPGYNCGGKKDSFC